MKDRKFWKYADEALICAKPEKTEEDLKVFVALNFDPDDVSEVEGLEEVPANTMVVAPIEGVDEACIKEAKRYDVEGEVSAAMEVGDYVQGWVNPEDIFIVGVGRGY